VKSLEQEPNEQDVRKQLQAINVGDLICVEWCDASMGKSSGFGRGGGSIDVPVSSWGVFIGILGTRIKHIVLAQNSFRFADAMFDLDYTAIPISWAVCVSVLIKEHIPKQEAVNLSNCFLRGGHRSLTQPRSLQRCIVQKRLSMHGRSN
jgi:hypothetical protein